VYSRQLLHHSICCCHLSLCTLHGLLLLLLLLLLRLGLLCCPQLLEVGVCFCLLVAGAGPGGVATEQVTHHPAGTWGADEGRWSAEGL
jgi:hypothetical protein